MPADPTTTKTLPDGGRPLPDGRWVIDPGRSTAAFDAKGTWGLIPVKGAFATMSGELEVADGVSRGELVLDAASLDTGNDRRDKHLRSADFFDVENYPEVVFRLQELAAGPAGDASAEGILQVREVSHPVTVDLGVAQLNGGQLRLTASTRVERADVGLTWNMLGMMRGDLALSADIVLVPA